ncbi:MAG TPA: hypothetical protein VNF47_10975 [Streptosporangiaceae bacterium]|nr:hypothetical protein [Streptosporangiaceae bacterium]
MLAARWRVPVIAVALLAGTVGALVTSITQAGATAHPRGRPGGSATGTARALRLAATSRAPLVTDAVPRKRSKRGLPAPPLSAAMRRADAVRQAQARAYLRRVSPPAARDLAATQRAQSRDYFCGPAVLSEMLAQLKVVLPQRAAARDLRTSRSGTDWSNSRGYPVPRVLNAHQKRHIYVVVGLPWTPTRAQIRRYERDLVTDISRGRGAPIAGNGYEVPGGPHLVGHPPGQVIMHWFDIRGYSRSGAVTDYEDSVHGAASIGWSGSVPAYSSLSSAVVVYILGARGYVW